MASPRRWFCWDREAKKKNCVSRRRIPGIAERVRFEGFQRNPYPRIRHSRLLVVSSDSEGFGNVLVEALSCGTAVVSTRCPGGPVSILTGELSRGLAEMNATSLAEKCEKFIQLPGCNIWT